MPETFPTTLAISHTWDWVIFAAVYAGIAIGTIPFTRLNRSAIALLGAIAVVAIGRLSFTDAVGHVDFATLALLFALMVIAAMLRVAGFYTRIIEWIVSRAHKPWTLLVGVIAAAAILSAIFANDIICLAFAPVLCVGLQKAGRRPLPYLIALATSSNIGSAATIIGNPQNMLIGQSAHLSFGHYCLIAAPLVLACLVLNVLVVAIVYRKTLFTASEEVVVGSQHVELVTPDFPFRPWQVAKTLLIMLGLMLAFLFTGVPREISALVAAGLVLISRTQDPRKLFALVDWELILLFIGLFVVIGNVQQQGLMQQALDHITAQGVQIYQPVPFSLITVALSNIVSNVPAVLLLKHGLAVPAGTADPVTYTWYLLAVVSTFAGNFTLLGSIANLIVAEQSKPHGVKMGFVEYLKAGVPLTILTTVLAVVYFGWLV